MGIYSKYVWPALLDWGMSNEDFRRLRAAWVRRARGKVLEVGIGSGLNLPYYSPEVECVYGVDPSLELQRKARKRAAGGHVGVEFLSQSAEATLPMTDASMDTVVVTWTLCSIPDVPRALAEMRRVLKPDGEFVFLEHGRADDGGVASWQDRLTPVWKRIANGCHLNRKVDALIAAAGFEITELKTCYLPGPRFVTFTYQGVAKRGRDGHGGRFAP